MILFSEYRYKKKIKKQAATDFITQAPDRKTIINNAETYIKNALRESPRGVGVALINVDELKNINAAYGCKVGDAALARIYQTIASELRASDLFGRYSGSKFLLILTNASEQDMRCLYERLQQQV
jgi:diguanylate cyclase (GGDEF)-like protein